jgi:hypothetical protein
MKFHFRIACILLPALAFAMDPSPYAGEQTRAIKALSDAEVTQLLNGHGMGLARAAELNRYPGPRHVLDLATELGLQPAQTTELARIFDAMKAAALPLGRELVARETELDRLFATRRATDETVLALTREIGRLQGELRAVHLNAHVATVAVLSPAQVARYDDLRGYASGTASTVHDPSRHQP